ncbi:MAG: hypothetical protein HQL47_03120, partial [Gammaproteobacteria bacterium]|nr:hypothetical protein [Gammaproteobacteria bacterium]
MKTMRLIPVLLALSLLSGCGVNEFFASHVPSLVRSAEPLDLAQALKQARALEKANDWEAAEQLYQAALAQHGDNKLLRRNYANFKARQEDRMARQEVSRLVR